MYFQPYPPAGSALMQNRQNTYAFAPGSYSGESTQKKIDTNRKGMTSLMFLLRALLVPWIIFCVTLGVRSFWLAYKHPVLEFVITIALFVVVLAIGVYAFLDLWSRESISSSEVFWSHLPEWGALKNFPSTHLSGSQWRPSLQLPQDDLKTLRPSWSSFLFITALVAWILGICLGHDINRTYTQDYYNIMGLNSYTDVDPVTMRGQQIMDAGRINFVEGTHIAEDKAISFLSEKLYCAVPLTSHTASSNVKLTHYDFWAVGTGCCSDKTKSEFRCGDYDGKTLAGLRVLDDKNRDFYRLAVQQAESVYGIDSLHPIFVSLTTDAMHETNMLKFRANRYYMIALCVSFLIQLVLVGAAYFFASRKV